MNDLGMIMRGVIVFALLWQIVVGAACVYMLWDGIYNVEHFGAAFFEMPWVVFGELRSALGI